MRITEIKTVKVVKCIPKNPFMLKWLNPDGGFDYWLFGIRQEFTREVTNEQEFEPVIHYLDTAYKPGGVQRTLQRTAYEAVKIGYEGLTVNDVQGIQWVLSSPLVYWVQTPELAPSDNNYKVSIVAVKPGSFFIQDNTQVLQKLEMEIVKPKLFIQSA